MAVASGVCGHLIATLSTHPVGESRDGSFATTNTLLRGDDWNLLALKVPDCALEPKTINFFILRRIIGQSYKINVVVIIVHKSCPDPERVPLRMEFHIICDLNLSDAKYGIPLVNHHNSIENCLGLKVIKGKFWACYWVTPLLGFGPPLYISVFDDRLGVVIDCAMANLHQGRGIA